MDDISTWLNIALRWIHVITGICWIGSSFYFIWLDNSLAPPVDEDDIKEGVAGQLWAVHGGGFYHKKKYQVAPAHMPADLHWFKWEAYFTWLSGFLLLCLIYYAGANLYLIDKTKMLLTPPQATAIGLAFIGGGWLVYDTLCRSKIGANNRLFGLVWFAVLTAAAYALNQIFTGRGAYIHVGAMMGTVMAANVFMIIIPNQRKVVADLLAGKKPDPRLGKKAKQRSLHNNYMTLPVILVMISNHYPILFGGAYNWLILAGLGAVAFLVRHFFNLKHKGKEDFAYLLAGFALFVVIMALAGYDQTGAKTTVAAGSMTMAEGRAIVRTHCSACHSDTPTHVGMTAPPEGIMFDKINEIRKYAPRMIDQAVTHDAMPLGNETNMTPEERQKLGVWLKGLEGAGGQQAP